MAFRFALCRLEPDVFDALRDFAKRFGATRNNVFVAACFRALWRFLDFPPSIPQSIMVPTDVRRYLCRATVAHLQFQRTARRHDRESAR